MATHSSATVREEKPHSTNSNNFNLNGNSINNLNEAIRRRAQSLINDRSIDAQSRTAIRYGLEINDPWLPEIVRRIDAGETIGEIFEDIQSLETENHAGEKIEALLTMICRAGDEPEIKSAALLVLMATLENSTHPKVLANTAKHLAFARCGELNLYGMVDSQVAWLESELFETDFLVP